MMNLKYLLAFTAINLLASAAQARTEMYYVHSDHLGTPQVLTDKNQQVVWRRSQTPFGETVEESGTVIQPLRFPGQYEDPETGFHYNYFRDYDPTIGRYVQSDPIGLEGGMNTYGYVHQDPIKNYDPYGLKCWTEDNEYGGGPIVFCDGEGGWENNSNKWSEYNTGEKAAFAPVVNNVRFEECYSKCVVRVEPSEVACLVAGGVIASVLKNDKAGQRTAAICETVDRHFSCQSECWGEPECE